MELSSSYQSITDSINSFVTSQVGTSAGWTNLPGQLTKAVASSAGQVWGISQNSLWASPLPSTGNWQDQVITQDASLCLDIEVDDTYVYLLYASTDGSTKLGVGSAIPGQATWNFIVAPSGVTRLFSTHTYIWVQDASNNKQKCAKPCTMSNWIAVPDAANVKITSASATSLQGVDASGTPQKTDELLQTGWSSIPALGSAKQQTVIGDADQTALYGLDTTSQLQRCTTSSCIPISTQGFQPSNVTIDPASTTVWMTTATVGEKGNIFTKLDTPDATAILKTAQPLDQQRDKVKDQVADQYTSQTHVGAMQKQVNDVKSFLSQFFQVNTKTENDAKNRSGHLQELIQDQNTQLSQINNTLPHVQVIIATLFIVIAVQILLSDLLGHAVHLIAFLVLASGFGQSIFISKT